MKCDEFIGQKVGQLNIKEEKIGSNDSYNFRMFYTSNGWKQLCFPKIELFSLPKSLKLFNFKYRTSLDEGITLIISIIMQSISFPYL